jgi:hypothetical protein
MAKKPKHYAADEGLFGALTIEAGGADDAIDADPLALGATIAKTIPLRDAVTNTGATRQLPYSKQFSPGQIASLGDFLRAVDTHSGSLASARTGVYELQNPGKGPADGQKRTMAYNALLSAFTYCLLTAKTYNLTSFGKAVLALPTDEARLDLFARHILGNLHGAEMVLGVDELAKAGRKLGKEQLAKYFAERGLGSNPDGTDISGVRGWLTAVGVFEKSGWYVVNREVFERMADMAIDVAREAGGLNGEALAILEQLALSPNHESTSSELIRLLKDRPDLRITPAAFVKDHLEPLQKAGLVQLTKSTEGRGGYRTKVVGTPAFASDGTQALLRNIRSDGFSRSSAALQVPLADLVDRMRRTDLTTKERGSALEMFTERLMHRMGLLNVTPAGRPSGDEEFDAYGEALLPVHSRWQVQCKNSSTFTVDHAAREVGLAVRNRSTALLMVTTGRFSDPANEFVDDVIRYSPYTAVRIDGSDIDNLVKDESHIFSILRREAAKAKALRDASAGWVLGARARLPQPVQRAAEVAVSYATTDPGLTTRPGAEVMEDL